MKALLKQFHEIAANPGKQKDAYLSAGEQVVLAAPVYTPEEMIHAMGLVPMGAWGADCLIDRAKTYFPAFICSIMQSILELGIRGDYDGVSAIVIPSLCDSLKCLGENWKYAVPSIPFIPMVYPQNRANEVGKAFVKEGYRRVAADLEKLTGKKLTDESLSHSIAVYNEHNAVMRQLGEVLAAHPEITAAERSDIYKSAWFMRKEEHTKLVRQLLKLLEMSRPENSKIKLVTTGILCDSPELLAAFDDLGFQIAADDVAAESRQYQTDTPSDLPPLDALCTKFANMGNCSVLYDPTKARIKHIVETAQSCGAKGIVHVLTKFCDPEEFDFPILKKECDAAGLPILSIEIDRQMTYFEQARTLLETFRDMLVSNERRN